MADRALPVSSRPLVQSALGNRSSVDRVGFEPPRPCSLYAEEVSLCEEAMGWLRRTYEGSQRTESECRRWKADFELCRAWEARKDPQAKEALRQSEQEREAQKVTKSLWSFRSAPPKEWFLPLPERD